MFPNSLGYLPINLGGGLPGWCGDNMFGMRTAPNGMYNPYEPENKYSAASASGESYKRRWRDFHTADYQTSTQSYPFTRHRSDHLTPIYVDYEEEIKDENVAVGIRCVEVQDVACGYNDDLNNYINHTHLVNYKTRTI